jgi:outer membrane protein TolC
MKNTARAAVFAAVCFFLCGKAGAQLSFDEAAALAVSASKELKASRMERVLREGAWKLGLRSYLPEIGLSVSEDDRLSLNSADSFLKNYTLSAEQLLWDGGRLKGSRDAERAELVLLADQWKRQAGAIAANAVSAYRQLLLNQKVMAIREASLDSLREQYRILETEFELGRTTRHDLALAAVTVKEAELELEALRLQSAEAERNFAGLLGFEKLPALGESIDWNRAAVLPGAELVKKTALNRNADLAMERHVLNKKQADAKNASREWFPTLRATGSFTVSGQRYPLSNYGWSVGLSVAFSSPYFTMQSGGSMGWEPPYDRTARVQNSVKPLPDPAAGLGKKQAKAALALERENYADMVKKTERDAALALESARLYEERRRSALAALELAREKFSLAFLSLELGRITRLDLMDEQIELTEKEIQAAEAVIAVFAAEAELELMLNIPRGSLERFAALKGGSL